MSATTTPTPATLPVSNLPGVVGQWAPDVEVGYGLSGLHDLAIHGLQPVGELTDHLPERPADVFLHGPPGHAGQVLVDADEPKVPVQEGKPNRGAGQERVEESIGFELARHCVFQPPRHLANP
jgi:hypothetical protein